jgi:NMD protein affecting ribosome stability and mRNA decay
MSYYKNNRIRRCLDCGTSINGLPQYFSYCTTCAKDHSTHGNTHCAFCGSKVSVHTHSLCRRCYYKKCIVCGDRTGNPAFNYCKSCYSKK